MKKFPVQLIIGLQFIFLSTELYAQTPDWIWAKSVGGSGNELGNSIAIDTEGDGSIYVVGPFQNSVDFDPGPGVETLVSKGFYDLFILKLDRRGNFVWVKGIGGNLGSDVAKAVVCDPSGNGNIFITGDFIGTVDFDPGAAIANLSSAGSNDNFVLKLDKDGNYIWARAIRGSSNAGSNFLAVDPNGSGNIYVTGLFTGTADFDPGTGVFNLSSNGSFDIFVLKLNGEGDFVWARSVGGDNFDVAYHLALDTINGGHIYLTGRFRTTVDFDPGTGTHMVTASGVDDIYILKLNQNGDFVWVNDLGGMGYGEGNALVVDQQIDGGLYLAGRIGGGTVDLDPGMGVYNLKSVGVTDLVVCKFDKNGNFLWASQMGGTGSETNATALVKKGGQLYVVGFFSNTIYFNNNSANAAISVGNTDVLLLKLDDLGNFKWAKEMGGLAYDIGLSMALDDQGMLHITGDYFSKSIACGQEEIFNFDSTSITVDVFIAKLNANLTATEDDQSDQKISVYPNPTTDFINIRINDFPETEYQICLLNSLGVVVYNTRFTVREFQLNMQLLPDGIYHLRIHENDQFDCIKILKVSN
ncbi:MAG: T9SS type A sorting domain-containing protein [Saprospiraceae bacterium]|nr:T9SS type A sorting domain-containing protein [Saprospiraceae bacterium]